ncbi:YicC family protein [bacterium]|nr:YicC family protein [bacterium]
MSIHSMTGFGRGQAKVGDHMVSCDIRSVNNRFLDLNIRLPRSFMPLENKVREVISATISRGRLDIFINVEAPASSTTEVRFDAALAQQYLDITKKAQKRLGLSDPITTKDILLKQGVLTVVEKLEDADSIWPGLEAALNKALAALVRMRKREGQTLKKEMLRLLKDLAATAGEMEKQIPVVTEATRERATKKINDLVATPGVDPNRLEQEIAFYVTRSDVTEEVARLRSHLDELALVLKGEGPMGKKVDFLLQETNREITTFGNKMQSGEVSKLIVAAKALTEKLREQTQNLE